MRRNAISACPYTGATHQTDCPSLSGKACSKSQIICDAVLPVFVLAAVIVKRQGLSKIALW